MSLEKALVERVWIVESFADSCGIPMGWIRENIAEYQEAFEDWTSGMEVEFEID